MKPNLALDKSKTGESYGGKPYFSRAVRLGITVVSHRFLPAKRACCMRPKIGRPVSCNFGQIFVRTQQQLRPTPGCCFVLFCGHVYKTCPSDPPYQIKGSRREARKETRHRASSAID